MPIPSSTTSPVNSPPPATTHTNTNTAITSIPLNIEKPPSSSKKPITFTNTSTPSSPVSHRQHQLGHAKNKQKHTGPRSLLGNRRNHPYSSELSDQRIRNSQLGNLYAGSRFTGSQKCGDNKYDVVVDIQNVNLDESTLCGYLNIKGLTTEFPELTTYFEGEIIGPKYSFLTRKWQAQHYIDVAHWKRFPSFQKYVSVFNQDGFVYDPKNEDFVYMRWKEKFLVPDHHVDNIEGASFAGFYYVCFQRSTNTISGMYFYRHFTQWYQELSLQYDQQRCFGSYEFR